MHCTAQKNFPLRISSENVTKFAFSCEFVHIYKEILNEKLHFYAVVQVFRFEKRKQPDFLN